MSASKARLLTISKAENSTVPAKSGMLAPSGWVIRAIR